MTCHDLPLPIPLHPCLGIAAAVLTGTLAPFYRPRRIGCHDPNCPVAVDPYLAILISEIAHLYRRVDRVSKNTRAVERLGAVAGAVEVRSNDSGQKRGIMCLNGLRPLVFELAEVSLASRIILTGDS